MKMLKIALIAALACGAWLRVSADPTIQQDSYGWFSTSGYYAVEYFVDAYDNGTLQSLTVQAYDEEDHYWCDPAYGTGDGSHLHAHGWGVTIDGDVDGKIWGTDNGQAYSYDTEFYY